MKSSLAVSIPSKHSSSKGPQRSVFLISDCPADYHCCGVTRKQRELDAALVRAGHRCRTITPDDFWGTVRLPFWGISRFLIPSPYSYWKLASMIRCAVL